MNTRLLVGATFGLCAANSLLAYDRAEACSPPLECPQMRYPLDGATGVPTNTKLWTLSSGTLSLSAGDEPSVMTMAPIMTLPDALLPNTVYTVTLTPDPEATLGCEASTTLSFTTGSGPDAAPVPPAINDVTATYYPYDDINPCGPTEERFLVQVSLSPPLVADAVATRVYLIANGARVGSGSEHMLPANPSFNVFSATVENAYEIVAVSASGLESSASAFEVNEAMPPGGHDHGDSGCSAIGTAAGASGALALMASGLALALARRRRSHPSHQQQ